MITQLFNRTRIYHGIAHSPLVPPPSSSDRSRPIIETSDNHMHVVVKIYIIGIDIGDVPECQALTCAHLVCSNLALCCHLRQGEEG